MKSGGKWRGWEERVGELVEVEEGLGVAMPG